MCLACHFKVLLSSNIWLYTVEEKKKVTLSKISGAKAKVRLEITDLSNRLKDSREAIQKLQQELRVLESNAGSQSWAVKQTCVLEFVYSVYKESSL